MHSDRYHMRREHRSNMGQRHTRRSSLSPMAQVFVPGAQDYRDPLPHDPPHLQAQHAPSPLSQIHYVWPSTLSRLPSPEFPFYDTDRPYYRDEWPTEDLASYLDQPKVSAESNEGSIADDRTFTEQSKAGPQLGRTNQDRSTDHHAEKKVFGSHMGRTISCSPPNKPHTPIKSDGLADIDTTFDNHNTCQPSPASPCASIKTSTPNPYNNDSDNADDYQYHPLSSLLASIETELPSLASTDAEIHRWHSDALLPPSSPRRPHVKCTPNHEPGAIGDGRKDAVEYIMKRERFKKEHIAAARAFAGPFGTKQNEKSIRFSNQMADVKLKKEMNESIGSPWPVRVGESCNGGVDGPAHTIGRQMHRGAVMRTRQESDGASHDIEEALKQKKQWGWVQGADGKIVARCLSPHELEEKGKGNFRESRNGKNVDNKVSLT